MRQRVDFTLQQAQDYFKDDLFATEAAGVRIVEAEPGRAVCEMPLGPIHQNARGGVMGGALFTLADLAATVADWNPGHGAVTVDTSFQFLAATRGNTLTATATTTHDGRSMGFYHVDITDASDTLVACGTYTMAHLQ